MSEIVRETQTVISGFAQEQTPIVLLPPDAAELLEVQSKVLADGLGPAAILDFALALTACTLPAALQEPAFPQSTAQKLGDSTSR